MSDRITPGGRFSPRWEMVISSCRRVCRGYRGAVAHKPTLRSKDSNNSACFLSHGILAAYLRGKDVMAVCHGGVKGRGGFKLSAAALHPEDDYDWIVKGGTYQVLTTEVKAKANRGLTVEGA